MIQQIPLNKIIGKKYYLEAIITCWRWWRYYIYFEDEVIIFVENHYFFMIIQIPDDDFMFILSYVKSSYDGPVLIIRRSDDEVISTG